MTIKNLIKTITPNFVLGLYHLSLAHVANLIYGSPSEKLIVIGVTGTNGKSTTVNLIAKILQEAGYKVALTSTVNFQVDKKSELNKLKMTMPGRFFLQRLLSQAVKADCDFAVIESSSEGVLQHREIGIHYDCMVFTNLTPEHIQAHGSFKDYLRAKLEYFRHLENLPTKNIDGQKIPKVIVANIDDEYGAEFLDFDVDEKITYGKNTGANVVGNNLEVNEKGINFFANGLDFNLQLKGVFDFYNSLAAIAAVKAFEVPMEISKKALEKISGVPGRMELIDEGQPFKILVDYAPEPVGMKLMYDTVRNWHNGKIIHLLGSTGGGRDIARRKILGNIAGMNADIVIVTNEDPYDDDPQQIIHQVAEGAVEVGKVIKQNLFREPDRRIAIAKALSFARPGDLVILTGKGAEQKMAVKNGYIPWDDREVAREELKKLLEQKTA